MAMRLGSVTAFGTGILFDQFCWLDNFIGGHLGGNGIGILIVNANDGGESLNFFGTAVEGSTIRHIRCVGSAADMVFHGGSLDGAAPNSFAIDAEGSCNLAFFGTHIEQDPSCTVLTNDSGVPGPTVSFFGCQFVYPDGPALVFLADQINISVKGGKLNVAGGTTQTATLVTSNSTQNAIIEFDEIVLNSGGIVNYMISGPGGIKRVRFSGTDKLYAGLAADSYAQTFALVTNSTIDTTSGIAAATCSASVTGLRFTAGTVSGQRYTLINKSSFPMTFGDAATSLVADGASDVIATRTGASYVWAPEAGLWYRVSSLAATSKSPACGHLKIPHLTGTRRVRRIITHR
jgi:hypothetical protein